MKFSKKILFYLFATILISVLTTGISSSQQAAGQLFEKALYAEEIKGDLAEAVNIYKQILDESPGNRQVSARALLHVGMCYEKLGSQQARQAYRQLISKYSDQAGEVALARERIARLEASDAELIAKAEEHLKRGNELFKRWEYESAITEYENAVISGPNTELALNARYCIGQSWYRAGKYDKALATFTKLIEENPSSNIAPVTELMVAQVQYAIEINKNQELLKYSPDDKTIVDPKTGITFRKVKSLTGESDIITYTTDLNLSPNGKFLLSGNMVVPMDGTAPFELIDFKSTGIQATRGTWSPDGTKAAFYSGDALCVVPMSPETGHTTGPFKKINKVELKWQSNPGWSPDGKKLTYMDPKADLWVIGSDGNNLKQIIKSVRAEVGPAWSPDGKTIAFGYGDRNIGLYSIENDTFNEMAETGYRCFPIWSPDGKWIVGNQDGKLHFYNLNNKIEFEYSPPEETGGFFSWSKDGKKMLFFRTSYFYNGGLKIASSDGGPSFEPVPLLTNWWTVRWSKDNKFIAVQGEDDNGDIAIRIVPLSGGKSELITLADLPDGKPFPFNMSSNFEKLLFSIKLDKSKEDLYVVPISAEEAKTTGPPVKIFSKFQGEGPTTLSPDGEKVGLIHDGDIWVAFTNGNDPIQVTDFLEDVGYIKWTTDGKALLFSANSGDWSLLKNPGPDSEIIKLLDNGKKVECRHWNIDVSPDNTRVAVLTDEQIKIIPLDNKRSPQVLDISDLELNECFDLNWSPDGKNLVFIGTKEPDDPASTPEGSYLIYNVPVNGGQPVRVAPDDDDYKDFLSWSHDAKWIAYSPEKPVKVRPESIIWEVDFDEILEKVGK